MADDAVEDVDDTDEVLEVMLALWRLLFLWPEASIVTAAAAAAAMVVLLLLSMVAADSSTRLLLWCCLLRSRRMVLIVPVLPTIICFSVRDLVCWCSGDMFVYLCMLWTQADLYINCELYICSGVQHCIYFYIYGIYLHYIC